MAFDATLEGSPDYGVYLYRGDGSIGAIAKPGDPAAGGGEVVSAIQPRVNDKGDIVYAAEVTGPSGEQAWSLFSGGEERQHASHRAGR